MRLYRCIDEIVIRKCTVVHMLIQARALTFSSLTIPIPFGVQRHYTTEYTTHVSTVDWTVVVTVYLQTTYLPIIRLFLRLSTL
ncbi:uncharacterized protein DEA37_0014838 [Paragonimus westermani]|uniref:Uncharacterized protein n=1 Tax=Paragonimus westermani TaxID=34504 RepID=A0A5J4N674_9TREM|nr:uncharacterized protein DEA37_0014838 [Paragonimus westermani]